MKFRDCFESCSERKHTRNSKNGLIWCILSSVPLEKSHGVAILVKNNMVVLEEIVAKNWGVILVKQQLTDGVRSRTQELALLRQFHCQPADGQLHAAQFAPVRLTALAYRHRGSWHHFISKSFLFLTFQQFEQLLFDLFEEFRFDLSHGAASIQNHIWVC